MNNVKPCLKCERLFKSKGKFNRICPRCTETNRNVVVARGREAGPDGGNSWYNGVIKAKSGCL